METSNPYTPASPVKTISSPWQHSPPVAQTARTRNRLLSTLSATFLVLISTLLCDAADEWPSYRGPNHNGTTLDGIRSNWTQEPPKVLWRVPMRNGFSSFTAGHGKLFTLVERTIGAELREMCIALDAASGQEIWAAEVGTASEYDGTGISGAAGPRSTPVVADGRVYVLSAYLGLFAINAENGEVVWQRNLVNDYGIAIGYHYLGGHPSTPWTPPPETTNTWISPSKTTDEPSLALVADLNVYAYSYQRILAPHGPRGAAIREDSFFDQVPEAYGMTPKDIGARGGNVARLEGSVAWKDWSQMRQFRASQLWEDSGSFGFW